MKESEYYNVTYNLTLSIAKRLARLNPGMIFCYISGAGADIPKKQNSCRQESKARPRLTL